MKNLEISSCWSTALLLDLEQECSMKDECFLSFELTCCLTLGRNREASVEILNTKTAGQSHSYLVSMRNHKESLSPFMNLSLVGMNVI